jgi:hypothetical protein
MSSNTTTQNTTTQNTSSTVQSTSGAKTILDTSLITLPKTLSKKQHIANIINTVVSKLNELENLDKNDLGILQYILNIVHNVADSKYKLKEEDIQNIVLACLNRFFKLSPDEILIIKNNINFLYQNKDVLKVSSVSKLFKFLNNFLKKSLN